MSEPLEEREAGLNARILEADRARDIRELFVLYETVGRRLLDEGDDARGYFFLTQAYVHALEAGEQEGAARLYQALAQAGRDT